MRSVLIYLVTKNNPHELCLQPFTHILVYAVVGIAIFITYFTGRQMGYVARVMLHNNFYCVGVALCRG